MEIIVWEAVGGCDMLMDAAVGFISPRDTRMIGDRLGKWVIFKELGRGGMGRVYLAQEELNGRKAALKILSAELAQDVGFLQRFQLEIEALSRLDHPGIVRFYEAGHENGLNFYAMEYVEGHSLEELVAEQGRVPWPEVLVIAEQICPALRHVHDHGIIHRDIKPSNILLSSEGQVKVTDFGIAKVFASTHLTATGGVVGTAEFLSPEQAAGKVVGKRSDLYCLGAVLYTLLTGRPPFTGASYVELLHKHRYAQCDRPQMYVPELPLEFDALVNDLLEKEPDKRPRDCRVLAKRLETIRRRSENKSQRTQAGVRQDETCAETVAYPRQAGPATLMSRLMRKELEQQKHGSAVYRFFNHPVVLVTLLSVCLAVFAWAFWPRGQEELYRSGAQWMASEQLVDMERGWRDYLEPLNRRFPDHPYRDEVEEFRRKLETARSPRASEAQRIYRQGEALRQQGDFQGAHQTWRNLTAVFGAAEAEREWVRRAEHALIELEKETSAKERWSEVRAALNRAAALEAAGKRAEAEKIWAAVEALYGRDPGAADILHALRRARTQAQAEQPERDGRPERVR